MIWTDAAKLAANLNLAQWRYPFKIVCTSGGFAPCHIGHLRLIQESKKLGNILVVIVNGDDFLLRKHGKVFMPASERAELIDELRPVDHTLIWEDESQTVAGALEILKPTIFAKGGDRTPENMSPEELEVCQRLGVTVVYGVGGAKLRSSSELWSNACR